MPNEVPQPDTPQLYNPYEFLTDTAERLYEMCQKQQKPIAVEVIALHLRLSYQQGVTDGLTQHKK